MKSKQNLSQTKFFLSMYKNRNSSEFFLSRKSVYFSDEKADDEEDEDESGRCKRCRKKRKAIIGQHKRWTNNIVYYSYGGGFSEYQSNISVSLDCS